MKKDVTVVILACDEEKNITPAVTSVLRVVKSTVSDYELIIIDDGSTDATGMIADELAKSNRKIRVIHHAKNLGFGCSFREGVQKATKTYVVGFPGDNDTSGQSLMNLINTIGEADLIISYPKERSPRSLLRKLISKSYVLAMNALFGLHLRYFNGSFICRSALLKRVPLRSKGFTVYAEAKVRLIASGASFKEVPFEHIGRKYGKSKALTLISIWRTLENILVLIYDILIRRKSIKLSS